MSSIFRCIFRIQYFIIRDIWLVSIIIFVNFNLANYKFWLFKMNLLKHPVFNDDDDYEIPNAGKGIDEETF